jgi:hypothetical protein
MACECLKVLLCMFDETKIINNVNVNNVSYGFSLDGNHNNFDAII